LGHSSSSSSISGASASAIFYSFASTDYRG